ncbi:hypothetical protein LDENG_00197030 [Lucifuga dentata]|nr:hypothetical protein LDENG_00197030 [Lucifuga dentata]
MALKTITNLKSATLRWSRKPKRCELSISLPLDDFRHLAHIGLDTQTNLAFGDLSAFHQGSDLLLGGSCSQHDIFLTSDHLPPSKPPRLFTPQIEKTRILNQTTGDKKPPTLPLLDISVKHKEKFLKEPSQEEVQVRYQEEQEEGGFLELDAAPGQTWQEEEEEESYFGLNFDLGPSILEEVLQVMEKDRDCQKKNTL